MVRESKEEEKSQSGKPKEDTGAEDTAALERNGDFNIDSMRKKAIHNKSLRDHDDKSKKKSSLNKRKPVSPSASSASPPFSFREDDDSSDVEQDVEAMEQVTTCTQDDTASVEIEEDSNSAPPSTIAQESASQESASQESVSPADIEANDETTTQDEVYSAYLAPNPTQQRRTVIDAVSARLHPLERRRMEQERRNKRRMYLGIMAGIVIAAALAISLGVTLGGKDMQKEAPVTTSTPAPTSVRFGEMVSLLESISNSASLLDPSSPQYQAAQWMAEEDELFGDLATVDKDHFHQRYVMALFYFATGGPTSWLETFFFLKPDVHECEWRDTAIPNTQSWVGYVGVYSCTADQWVDGIEINQNNLSGTLPDELGSLSSLTDLTVYRNKISGTLPTSLFNLANLQYLDFWSNEISGTIPTEVGQATSLLSLLFRVNLLTGTIPSEIGNLRSLDQLAFDRNFLTGTIPTTLLLLSNITVFDLAKNGLTGTLPPVLWSSWPNLTSISVMTNMLSGTISNNLDLVPSVEHLILQDNFFTGPFPSSIVKLSNVASFDIAANSFTGPLPNDWTNLSLTLDWLVIARNHLTGTLPQSLGSLSMLEDLDLFYNEFNGTIPTSVGDLTKLRSLQCGHMNLTGTVPKSFVRLSSLQRLTLHRSKLTGDLSFLCNGTKMIFPYINAFAADCFGENAEVICPCCNACCNIHDTCYERSGNAWV